MNKRGNNRNKSDRKRASKLLIILKQMKTNNKVFKK